MCVFEFSETTWPTEAKFHVASPQDHRGNDAANEEILLDMSEEKEVFKTVVEKEEGH